jgi:hypothetical protein
VRSHAKAPSAGSNSGQGASFGSLRQSAALLAALCAFLAAVCLAPASASALGTHLFLETFGGASQPTFTSASGLAVDQSSGDLLVIDPGAGTVSRWNADGTPANFSALGTNMIDGQGGADETPRGGLTLGLPEEVNVVVDNSGGATDGDIYVTGGGAGLIDIFDEDGSYLGQLNEYEEGGEVKTFGEACGVAVDPDGNVYVGDFSGRIHKYEPMGSPVTNADNSANFPFSDACTLAAGAASTAGSIFPAHWLGLVSKLDATTGEEKYVIPTGAITTETVNPATGNLYLASGGEVSEYDASGQSSATLLSGFSSSELVRGIAVDAATGNVYVTREGSSTIEVWGPFVPLQDVITEDASDVITTTATLNGTIRPEGKTLTDCYFEYGTTTSYGTSVPCFPAAASIPSDSSPHAVKADIGGLNANTTYHFRLVAVSADGTVEGADRTLVTAIGPPAVSAQSVEAIGFSDAILSAKVNPKGAKTTYHVEYGPTGAYGQSSPESQPIGFGGDDSSHDVSVHLDGLTPGTEYHFRFVATSSIGSDEGPDAKFKTYVSQPPFGSCPNDHLRSGFGARLPDCRAYEQATPIDKHGANAQGKLNLIQASSVGDRVTFFTNGGLPTTGGSTSLSPFMASRGAAGWSSDGLIPATNPGEDARVVGWSDDLSTTLVSGPAPGNVGQALYLRDSDTAAFQLGPTGGVANVTLAGFATDTSHLIFETGGGAPLAPGAIPLKPNLYNLDNGALTVVGRIPSGAGTSCDDLSAPACVPAPEGAFAGPYNWEGSNTAEGGVMSNYYTQNTISRDGSRVFFTAAGTGQLYMREDGTRTVQVSASQRTVPDPNGARPAAFMAATPDGSKVFFTSCEKLTDDSTAFSTAANACTPKENEGEEWGQDLYVYDVDSGELTDLTVDTNPGDPKGAAVRGVLGISDDGSHVYFVANGVLAPGAAPGNCRSGSIKTCNLYLYNEGAITFIAALSQESTGKSDGPDWQGRLSAGTEAPKTSRVAVDGSAVLFSSTESLTGYNNLELTKTSCEGSNFQIDPCLELFRYSAPDEELICVSCNPTGLPPRGEAVLGSNRSFLSIGTGFTFLTRNLSADGNRVFFESADTLLPTDTNGVVDVYEWEAEGSGSCETPGGCIYLISSGTSPAPAQFADASASGDDVFFFSDQQLVPGDRDQIFDVYDASVEGGLASQHALAPPTCTTTACQVNPAPPPEQTPASASFSGPGNLREGARQRRCPKGKRKVRRAGKVRCQRVRKHSKRHNNRGGAK